MVTGVESVAGRAECEGRADDERRCWPSVSLSPPVMTSPSFGQSIATYLVSTREWR